MPTAFITGIDGQDGSYLAEILLEKGYRVIGNVLFSHNIDYPNIKHIQDDVELVSGNLNDQSFMVTVLENHAPDEVYNFAAQSFVPVSWSQPVLTGDITALGVARLLEAIRLVKPEARFYQASSSELFGDPLEEPQNELTPLNPRNPYGVSKAYAHWLTITYRRNYQMFACSGILFNHESPRRGIDFVTRKITHGAARIKLGLQKDLGLGNLDARRDWGYAKDYVQAMWLMLQQDQPDDYVIGTGVTHSVREFCQAAFQAVGLNYEDYVYVDQRFYRPVEPTQLVADPSKAKAQLGWRPRVGFDELVAMMVEADLNLLRQQIT